MSWHLFETIVKQDVDPITDIFNHDWAAVGGWSLFLGLALFNVVGIYRGWVIPGWMYRNQAQTLDKAMDQNRVLLAAADITKHFFETTVRKPKPTPKRRTKEPSEVTHVQEQRATSTHN